MDENTARTLLDDLKLVEAYVGILLVRAEIKDISASRDNLSGVYYCVPR